MGVLPPDPDFIPLAERPSENVGFRHYIGKILKALAITKAATFAGGIAGDKLGGPVAAGWGATLAGTGAALYEGHQHWAPMKGMQERVGALLPEVKEELDPEHLRRETVLQTQIAEGLARQEQLFTELVRRGDKKKTEKSNPPSLA